MRRGPPVRAAVSGLDAIVRDEVGGVAVGLGDSGGGDGFTLVDCLRDREVEVEKLLEKVFLCGEAVRVEDGGVEGGVGIFEGVCAREFECPVEGAKAALDGGEGLGAESADGATSVGDLLDLLLGRGLRPREGVEDGSFGVVVVNFVLQPSRLRPIPRRRGLRNSGSRTSNRLPS